MKKQFNKVQKLVYAMLTENTGKHMLDSGGTDSRGWQRNQKKTILDFYNEQAEQYFLDTDSKYPEIERSVSVFHYLSNLELDEICDRFNKANKDAKDWDGDLYGVSAKAEKVLFELSGEHKIDEPRIWNTYNGDSDLSQTLQGANLRLFNDGQFEDYVLVQIHNGADVRGGYTDAKLFKVTDDFYSIREYMDKYDLMEELEYITVIGNDGKEVDKTIIENFLNELV
jgi:hypothetical protein